MSSKRVAGTDGYGVEAPALLKQYESVSCVEMHRPFLHLLPAAPADILDIGAGTGRDAAGFAAMGHRVVAVEPTPELRNAAMALHPSGNIEWVDDHLPHLDKVLGRGVTFDAAMLTAVWMHLDAAERRTAMPRVARLVRDRGVLIMSLRHGPVPAGRRMFDVGAEETIRLAAAEGFFAELVSHDQDWFGRAGVNWTGIAFRRNGAKTAE